MRIEIRVLYIIYFLYLLGVFISTRGALLGLYSVNLFIIMILAGMIFYNKVIYETNSISRSIIIFIFIAVYSLMVFINSKDINGTLLSLKIFLLFIYFRLYKIELKQLLFFINRTYLIFVLLSSLFFYLLPNVLNPLITHPSFYVDLGFYKYLIFQSIQGSASTIDSYSGLVLILNLFIPYENNNKRTFYIFLSVLLIILSLKMTPLVALVFSFFAHFLIRNKNTALIYLIIGITSFITVLFFLFKNPTIFNIPFTTLMYIATHARSMIWTQQLMVLWENYDFFDYVFGNFSSELFSVRAFQITGLKKDLYYDNPHNTYMLLFYRWPLLFTLLLIGFIRSVYQNYSKNMFVIVSFIFVACFSNSAIISLQNPIYIIILCYIANLKNHDIKIS